MADTALLPSRSTDVLRWAKRSDTLPGPRKMAGNDIGMGPAVAVGLIAGGALAGSIALAELVVAGTKVSIVRKNSGIYRPEETLRVRKGQRQSGEGPRMVLDVAYVKN